MRDLVGETEAVRVTDGVNDSEGVFDGVPEVDGLTVGETEFEAVFEGVGVHDFVIVREDVIVGLSVRDGDFDGVVDRDVVGVGVCAHTLPSSSRRNSTARQPPLLGGMLCLRSKVSHQSCKSCSTHLTTHLTQVIDGGGGRPWE